MKEKKCVLVTLADKNYLVQAKQLFSSVYHNSGWKWDYMLLAHEIPDDQLAWFREKGILVKHVRSLSKRDFPWLPATVLSKFYVFTEEFKKWDIVVFLDGDIIVRASLDGLTNVTGFAAVADIDSATVRSQFLARSALNGEKDEKDLTELKAAYDLNIAAFNSGVFSFTTDIIKKDTFARLRKLITKFGRISKFEQSLLNLYFYRKWQHLPMAYNTYFIHVRQGHLPSRGIRFEGIVNHYIFNKPWKYNIPKITKDWEQNLAKAERIDLSKRPGPKKVWTKKELEDAEKLLRFNQLPANPISRALVKSVRSLDRTIGLFGLWLKRSAPGLYRKIKV